MGLRNMLQHNGWAQVLPRAAGSARRRLRDSLTARRLGAPGFRIGRHPRLQGLSHMRVGRGFSGGDDLWLDAITEFNGHSFQPELIIGDHVNFSDSVHIACMNRVEVGSGTLIGSRVIVSDHSHGIYNGNGQSSPDVPPNRRPLWSAGQVTIGKNVWIGDGVAVLAGAHIGDGAVIGANSVVTGTIPAATIALGAPARPVRAWDAGAGEWLPMPAQPSR
jgi:acetyltransferase-like isoleucine patch superfamily enzyme